MNRLQSPHRRSSAARLIDVDAHRPLAAGCVAIPARSLRRQSRCASDLFAMELLKQIPSRFGSRLKGAEAFLEESPFASSPSRLSVTLRQKHSGPDAFGRLVRQGAGQIFIQVAVLCTRATDGAVGDTRHRQYPDRKPMAPGFGRLGHAGDQISKKAPRRLNAPSANSRVHVAAPLTPAPPDQRRRGKGRRQSPSTRKRQRATAMAD